MSDMSSIELAVFAWVAEVAGGKIVSRVKASGGNRRQSWAVDVETPGGVRLALMLRFDPRPDEPGAEPWTIEREAAVFRAIRDIPIRVPKYVGFNAQLRAVLTDRATGVAELRHLKDDTQKQHIARQFMADLATLHRWPTEGVALEASVKSPRIADHIVNELDIWEAMYREVGSSDPLLEFAFLWLRKHVPQTDRAPVLTHGDAGPGNFMYDKGELTALIDWEFAHLGDPMDDLAWFSMRCVMEPVPDYFDALRCYEEAVCAPIDRDSLLYHRVLVSTRVVVIRHRAFAGEPAHAIVSRGLNRRLLVEALAAASGSETAFPEPPASPETALTALYDKVIGDLGNVIVPKSTDKAVIAAAKNAAKVVKYLKAIDRFGPDTERIERDELEALLGSRPATVDQGQADLCVALKAGDVSFEAALRYFAGAGVRGAQLSAEASGSIAGRHYISI
ncbi:MAG: phosphotransferase family protein [Novosphingobium sp.]|nr:phosphotransferase family protein [Novosphingobium sp.]